MRSTKSIVIGLLLFIVLSLSGCDGKKISNFDKELMSHIRQLEKDPTNCFLHSQVAALYQIKKNYKASSEYYWRAYELCPENILDQFQSGLSLYLSGKETEGIKRIQQSITKAEEVGDSEMVTVLEKELKLLLGTKKK